MSIKKIKIEAEYNFEFEYICGEVFPNDHGDVLIPDTLGNFLDLVKYYRILDEAPNEEVLSFSINLMLFPSDEEIKLNAIYHNKKLWLDKEIFDRFEDVMGIYLLN